MRGTEWGVGGEHGTLSWEVHILVPVPGLLRISLGPLYFSGPLFPHLYNDTLSLHPLTCSAFKSENLPHGT